jgi:hypothetical protein
MRPRIPNLGMSMSAKGAPMRRLRTFFHMLTLVSPWLLSRLPWQLLPTPMVA